MNRTENPNRTDRGSRIFTVAVLALLGALILAAIFVPLGVFRSRGEVIVSCGSVTVRRDLYLFWLSAYKYDYLSEQIRAGIDATDTPEYWYGTTPGGITRAAYVRERADAWIKRVVFAAAFFEEDDRTLGERTLNELRGACDRLLQYELNSEGAYNRAAKPIGFTFSTVRRAFFYQFESEAFLSAMDDAEFDAFCALADSEVTLSGAAEKIDLVTLNTDRLLYDPAFLPRD